MSKNSFLKGAVVLGVAGLIVKILGAFFRIPLGRLITSEGMGYYQTAYPIYVLLLSISTSGFPTADILYKTDFFEISSFLDSAYASASAQPSTIFFKAFCFNQGNCLAVFPGIDQTRTIIGLSRFIGVGGSR